MENDERKILIEVNDEEYEKIKAGALSEEVPTRYSVLESLTEQDLKKLISEHRDELLKAFEDKELVYEVIKRTSLSESFAKGLFDSASYREGVGIKGRFRDKEFEFNWSAVSYESR